MGELVGEGPLRVPVWEEGVAGYEESAVEVDEDGVFSCLN